MNARLTQPMSPEAGTETFGRDRMAGRALAWMGAVLVPLWIPFDWVFSRDYWVSFAIGRVSVSLVLVVLAVVIARLERPAHLQAAIFLVMGMLAGLIGWMMALTSAYVVYFIGFSLVQWASGLVLTYSARKMAALQAMMLGLVAGFQALHPEQRTLQDVVFASSFLVTSAVLCVVSSAIRWAGVSQVSEAKRAQSRAELQVAEERASNHAKSAFLARMSHELRTPLNAILGYSELIEEELADAGVELVTDDLDKVKRASRHLLSLIDDILDLSRIEAGELVIEPQRLAIAPIIDDVLAELWNLAARKRIHLQAEIAPDLGELTTDPKRLRQIVINLVTNALKFTEQGGVQLIARRTAGGIRLEVHDSGVGIEGDHIERVFQPFVQVDGTTTRKNGGSGLGLAIVRDLVELLGGRISVASVPGSGSTFTVDLGDIPDTVAR